MIESAYKAIISSIYSYCKSSQELYDPEHTCMYKPGSARYKEEKRAVRAYESIAKHVEHECRLYGIWEELQNDKS